MNTKVSILILFDLSAAFDKTELHYFTLNSTTQDSQNCPCPSLAIYSVSFADLSFPQTSKG